MARPSPGTPRNAFEGRVVEGRYVIERALGSGAVGTVFSARDQQTGQSVAVKLWHGTGEGGQARARFVREAKALDTLRHPHIVEVYGAGLLDEQPYVVMEFLRGQTLEDLLIDGTPLPVPMAMLVARQMLSALAYAHDRGVVHRDLKPENIFLCQDRPGGPQVKLLDYGLAKFLGAGDDPLGGAQITMTGMVMGTPLYMPPEQAAGGHIDERVDVYSAGCILFEMFSGRLPYLGDDFGALIRAHVTSPIPILAEAIPTMRVTAALQALLDKAMAKSPDQRFDNASQMLTALEMLPNPPLRPLDVPTAAPQQPRARGPVAAQPPQGNSLAKAAMAGGILVALIALALILLK